VYTLDVHPNAAAEILNIYTNTPETGAKIAALIKAIQEDDYLLESLSVRGHGEYDLPDDLISVDHWIGQQRQGNNIWRFKGWNLDKKGAGHRFIYAYLPQKNKYVILAVIPRSIAYDSNHPITHRIQSDYANLQY
jgi:hypothetical protein